MSETRTIIISDIHLGSRYCRCETFHRFLDTLPANATLILNGDTVDRWQRKLNERQREALDRVIAESYKRHVIWIRGNHDWHVKLEDPGRIQIETSYSIGNRLYLNHGYDFDDVMTAGLVFKLLFRGIHELRILLGARSIHVAHYAKRWPKLYDVLRKRVANRAVAYAGRHGYAAVTCGHTHSPEDDRIDGIRYINTGAWTESDIYYLLVTDTDIELRQFEESDPENAP